MHSSDTVVVGTRSEHHGVCRMGLTQGVFDQEDECCSKYCSV